MLLLFSTLGGSDAASAQEDLAQILPVEWEHRIGDQVHDESLSQARPTRDGGTILVGSVMEDTGIPANPRDQQVSLVKVDQAGNLEWRSTFGGADRDQGIAVEQTEDGGYLVLTSTRSFGVTVTHVFLIKTTAGGSEVWSRLYASPTGYDFDPCGLRSTQDGGYLLAGTTSVPRGYLSDSAPYCVKIDATGNILWSQIYDELDQNLSAHGMDNTRDGGFVLVGFSNNKSQSSARSLYTLKIDGSGTKQWAQTIPVPVRGADVKQTPDGGYLVTGSTLTTIPGGFVAKLDDVGNEEWGRYFKIWSTESYALLPLADGHYLILANTSLNNAVLWLIKVDLAGNALWSALHHRRGSHLVKTGYQTLEGSFILAGEESLGFPLASTLYLMKLAPEGTPPVPDPELVFEASLWGDKDDSGVAIRHLRGDYYAVAGTTTSRGAGASDIFFTIVKNDHEHCPVYLSHTYGTADLETAHAMQRTSDRGFIIVGDQKPSNYGPRLYVVRIDMYGRKLWARSYGDCYCDECGYGVTETADGGYVVVGRTSREGSQDIYLVKLDTRGRLVWAQTFGEHYKSGDCGYDVIQARDGNLVIVGSLTVVQPSSPYRSESTDVYLLKTDAAGNEIWSRTYGGDFTDVGYSVVQTADGGYLVAGEKQTFATPDRPSTDYLQKDIYLLKTDPEGNLVWSKTIGGPFNDWATKIIPALRGDLVAANRTLGERGGSDACLIKIDGDGKELWSRIVVGPHVEQVQDVCLSREGDYVLTGKQDWQHLYLCKLTHPLTGPFIRGDSNGDGLVNRDDAMNILYSFPGPYASDIHPFDVKGAIDLTAADANADGIVDYRDAFYLFRYLILGSPPPPAPFPEPGGDETAPAP